MGRRELKVEALESCQFRGHTMGYFKTLINYPHRYIGEATCFKCGKTVVVNTCPLPNEIGIGGEAVALDCKGE